CSPPFTAGLPGQSRVRLENLRLASTQKRRGRKNTNRTKTTVSCPSTLNATSDRQIHKSSSWREAEEQPRFSPQPKRCFHCRLPLANCRMSTRRKTDRRMKFSLVFRPLTSDFSGAALACAIQNRQSQAATRRSRCGSWVQTPTHRSKASTACL